MRCSNNVKKNKQTIPTLILSSLLITVPVTPAFAGLHFIHHKHQSSTYPNGYLKRNPYYLSRQEIADLIGWKPDPCADNFCGGYYLEPVLFYKQKKQYAPNEAPVHLTADKTELSQVGPSALSGNVVVTQPDRRVEADSVYINRDPDTGQLSTLDAYGKVVLREPGKLVIADKAHIKLDDRSGSLSDVVYRMTFGNVIEPRSPVPIPAKEVKLEDTTAWGIAEKVIRRDSGVVDIINGTYTTCPPTEHTTWMVKADKMILDRDAGRGTARNAKLYFEDKPILYSPYFNFPLDKRRQTGFLFPSMGHSTDSGYEVSTPFYWNIAPNYDATITPKFMTKRILQLGGEFRYLTEKNYGNFHGSIVPHDPEFADFKDHLLDTNPPGTPGRSRLKNEDDTRYFASWQNNTYFNEHWSSYVYLNHVSDDYYFTDLGDDPSQITNNQIINQGTMFYNSEHWHFKTNLQGYQTLHPLDQAPIDNQYRMLPQLVLNGNFPLVGDHFNIDLQNEAVYFDKDKNPGQSMEPVTGSRINIQPGVSFPYYWAAGFLIPRVQVSTTTYDLQNQVRGTDGQRLASNFTRVLPIVDIDAGLIFDRNFNFAGTDYIQTLEPRLFYLYVPYRNQDDIPLFDTDVQPFSFEQLFRTNRFSGIDRIGDANQISAALTTRFLNEDTGAEKMRASIGQIYYFEHRRVNVKDSTEDLVTLENSVPSDTPSSPIVGEIKYHLDQDWSVDSSIAWDPNFGETNNAYTFFQYKPDEDHILNLGYVFLKGGDQLLGKSPNSSENDLNQTDFSIAWPIAERWKGMARWNYNLSHTHAQTYFVGVQYDSCCWAIRLVAGREFQYLENDANSKNKPVFDNKIYLEFALKGLGDAALNSASGMLTDGIPGFTDNFGVVNTHNLTNVY